METEKKIKKRMRSLLFVPAREKMLKKIPCMDADAYIIDLEESIEVSKKEETLENLKMLLPEILKKTDAIIVRLNKKNYINEVKALDRFKIDFMLPKFENIEEYGEIGKLTDRHAFYALIETAVGMVNIREIAMLKELTGLAFGAEDFMANVGLKEKKYLYIPRFIMVTYARAFNKTVYDAACFQLNDNEKFMTEVNESYDMGFDGKMAIHPKHISYINKRFIAEDIDKFIEIVNKYEYEGKPVLVVDGNVYEKMHIDYMKRKIVEGLELNK